jgi:outer membrane protein
MKKIAMILIFALLAASGIAQDTKVAVVDIERVVATSEHGKKMQAEMTAFLEKTRAAITALEAEAQKLQTQLGDPKVTPQAASDLERQLEDKTLDLKRMREDKTAEAKALETSSIQRIERALIPVMEKITKDNGYTMLLNARMQELAWADPSLDITDKVIEAFNLVK